MALRAALQAVYKSRRDATVVEAIWFLIMLALFVFIIHDLNDVQAQFATHDAIVDLLFDEEFLPPQQYKKNFMEIMTPAETWDWLTGPFLEATWPDEHYDGSALSPVLQKYMLSTYRRVGPVQFRQVRVTNTSCDDRRFPDITASHINRFDGGKREEMGRFDTLTKRCWAEFRPANEDKATHVRGLDTYTWQDTGQPLAGLFGIGVGSYGTGGYVNILGPDRLNASTTLSNMFQDEWFDRGTRAIAIDWTVYNTESRLATSIHVMFEHDEAAHMIPWYRVASFRVATYTGLANYFRAAAEVAFIVFWLRQLFVMVQDVWAEGLARYFLSFSHSFDIVLVVMQFLYMVTWLTFLFNGSVVDFDVESVDFVYFFGVGELFTQTATFAGVVGLMMTLRLFVFLGLSKRMLTVWLTIQRALPDMLAFFAGAFVLVAGFAIMAYFIFGFIIRDYHNFVSALSALLRMALGDFDYTELAQSRPQLAPIFFGVFVCVIYLLALTVFIGILTRYFEATHTELKVVDRWKETTPSFENEIGIKLSANCIILRTRCRHCFWGKVLPREAAAAVSPTAGAGGISASPRHSAMSAARPSASSGTASADSEAFEMKAVRRQIAAAQNQLELLRLQSAFFRAATKCASVARFNNGIDLQQYFEETYELEPNSDRLFITKEALAVIIGKRFPSRSNATTTIHGVHVRRSDFEAAQAIIKAYQRTRTTQFLGTRLEMETAELRAVSLVRPFSAGDDTGKLAKLRQEVQGRISGDSSRFLGGESAADPADSERPGTPSSSLSPEQKAVLARRSARVAHIDTLGGEVDRVLVIDSGHMALWADFCANSKKQAGFADETTPTGQISAIGCRNPVPPPQAAAMATQDAQLLVLDLQARPVRSLPLHLLVLTELFRDDPRYAELVFSSKDVPIPEEKARGGLNLNIRVRFESAAQRMVFMEELLSCASAATTVLDDAADGIDEDDAHAVPVKDGDEAMAIHTNAPKAKRLSMASGAVAGLSSLLKHGQRGRQVQALLEEPEEGSDDDEGTDAELEDATLASVAQAASQDSPRASKASRLTMNPLRTFNRTGALLRDRAK